MITAQSRWNARNKDVVNAARRRWYARNREREIERSLEHKRNNRQQAVQTQLKRQRGDYIPKLARAEVASYYGTNCAYCNTPCEGLDHLQPVSKGGDGYYMNLAPCCRICNSIKGNRPIWTMLCQN